jgi:WD40 repeat protein
MNQKAGGSPKNADLYDAMLFALEQNDIIKPFDNFGGEPDKDFTIDNSGRIHSINDNGLIVKYKVMDNGQLAMIESFEDATDGKTPVETAKFITPSLVAVSTKNRTSYLVNTDTKQHTRLPSSGYIKAASQSPDGKYCAIAYHNGDVVIMPLSGDQPESKVDFVDRIADIYFHDNDHVYILFHDGSLMKWQHKTGDIAKILPASNGQNAFKMAAIKDKNLLAICYSEGDIQYINLKDDSMADKKPGAHSKIENLVYDPNTGILAMSSADKRISLINTNDFNEKPLVIEEHSLDNHRVTAMCFNNKGVLFAFTDDGKLRLWDTNPATYATALSTMNIAPLSQSEWDLIMGRDFSEK